MNLQQAPGTPFDHGDVAGPFRGFGYRAPSFTPAGSGGFAAKYVALAMLPLGFGSALALSAAAEVFHWPEGDLDALMPAIIVPVGLLFLGAVLTWIYKSWEFLPPALRRDTSGRTFTPAAAVLLLFVPLFNLYWTFAQSLGLCDAVDAALVQSGKAPASPRNLALVCGIVQLIPLVNWLLGPVLWLTFMFLVDRAKRQLAPVRGQSAATGPAGF